MLVFVNLFQYLNITKTQFQFPAFGSKLSELVASGSDVAAPCSWVRFSLPSTTFFSLLLFQIDKLLSLSAVIAVVVKTYGSYGYLSMIDWPLLPVSRTHYLYFYFL